jgi:hypothetical protein
MWPPSLKSPVFSPKNARILSEEVFILLATSPIRECNSRDLGGLSPSFRVGGGQELKDESF